MAREIKSLKNTYIHIFTTLGIAIFFYNNSVSKLLIQRGLDVGSDFPIITNAEFFLCLIFSVFTLINIVYLIRKNYQVHIKNDLRETQFDLYFRRAVMILVIGGATVSFIALAYYAMKN